MQCLLVAHPVFMKSILIPLAALFFCIGAVKASENYPLIAPKPEEAYAKAKSAINQLKTSCRKMSTKKAGEAFASYIDKQLVPHWIGTPWDYNGITQTPGKGKIACGYFVTTVLRDAGVRINRVKMAQCASETMINSLTKNKVNYSSLSFNEFINKVKAKGNGLSIIGLDNHTGFLYNDGKELWFIHSSVAGTRAVAKEKARASSVLYYSNYKVVGFISQDAKFIKRWLK